MDSSRFFDLSKPTALLAIGLMLVILVMVLPVPAWVMDIGLTLSFAFAILIFTTSIFMNGAMNAIHRANFHTIRVLAGDAVFDNNIGHAGCFRSPSR